MLKKVFISRPMPQEVLTAAQACFDVDLRPSNAPLSPDEMVQSLKDYDGIMPTLGDLYQPEIFGKVQNPRCRILANFGVGYNHIHVRAAHEAGVLVSNTPGAVTDATADIAMALMLMSARRTSEGERLLRAGKWEGWHPTQMLGLHLTNKTVGIVGMGRIGQAIAQRCHHGFGMKVAYFSRTPKETPFESQAFDSLTDLAAQVDILVICVPGSPETHHLINKQVFDAMQPHAHLVNIARGDVVQEAALIQALQTGQIGGAGLDVYEFEPQVPDALKAMENVVLLPHLGTAALDVRSQMGMMALENLKAVLLKDSAPLNPAG